jgi:hypothetical protein
MVLAMLHDAAKFISFPMCVPQNQDEQLKTVVAVFER